MSLYQNPFPNDPDRRAIWEMLVERDIRAFVEQDWSMVESDFIAEGFMGIDGRGLSNPDGWQITYPTLEAYRDEWLRQAKMTAETEFAEELEPALIHATTLRDIEIAGDLALVHKKFDGSVAKKDGGSVVLNWQSLYCCRKVHGEWKITGFTGYLPHPMGATVALNRSLPGEAERSETKTGAADPESLDSARGKLTRGQPGPVGGGTNQAPSRPAKSVPTGAAQHVTAGPYSPVLEVRPDRIIVISGQAAIDPAGNIVGDTIEEQSRYTLENCRRQLETAGCTPADVFKVNVYLTDLSEWGRFNVVYEEIMPAPRPVRTAVGTKLLEGLLVEVEMWAAI